MRSVRASVSRALDRLEDRLDADRVEAHQFLFHLVALCQAFGHAAPVPIAATLAKGVSKKQGRRRKFTQSRQKHLGCRPQAGRGRGMTDLLLGQVLCFEGDPFREEGGRRPA